MEKFVWRYSLRSLILSEKSLRHPFLVKKKFSPDFFFSRHLTQQIYLLFSPVDGPGPFTQKNFEPSLTLLENYPKIIPTTLQPILFTSITSKTSVPCLHLTSLSTSFITINSITGRRKVTCIYLCEIAVYLC